RHLRRLRPRLVRLHAAGERSPNVLALLAVESFYRPRWRRAGEYALWIALSLAAPGRLARLSVGPAQVQLRHWRALGHLDGLRPTPARLAAVRDWAANARVCRDFLAARGALDEPDPGRLTRLYTGWDRPGFARRLAAARSATRQIVTGRGG
ncbi:MAG TPA: hypothetical protein VHM02_12470, partial [Thermoanaerobaculia bacterium]|nr:hypothetical protein [Thermoanaerobaculia bacterium]